MLGNMIEEDIEECKSIFNQITEGSDTKIKSDLILSKLEAINIKLNPLALQDILNDISSNPSSELDLNSFSIIWYHLIRNHNTVNYLQIWEDLDSSKSGFIQTSLLISTIKQNDSTIPDEYLQNLIQDSNFQKNNQIDYTQFFNYLQSF
jgi:Ca2+-binding EF-hand superfamily protein